MLFYPTWSCLTPSLLVPALLLKKAVNHGVSSELLESVVSRGREMFSLPKEDKLRFKVLPQAACPLRACMMLERVLYLPIFRLD